MKKIIKLTLIFMICILFSGMGNLFSQETLTTISVQAAPLIKLNKSQIIMASGTKYTLKLQGTSKKVTWSTSNKKVVTVSSKGEITAQNIGTAKIRAICNSKRYFCTVTVESPKISRTQLTLKQGQSFRLSVTGSKQKITWSSSAPKIVS